ncbi:hypothetical protein C8J57DRAFT_1491516 [Mycena rebaudengoi]|nr:hypothetical protein C8J57DRAFT_1491516 [Mycena rebaudengoi]
MGRVRSTDLTHSEFDGKKFDAEKNKQKPVPRLLDLQILHTSVKNDLIAVRLRHRRNGDKELEEQRLPQPSSQSVYQYHGGGGGARTASSKSTTSLGLKRHATASSTRSTIVNSVLLSSFPQPPSDGLSMHSTPYSLLPPPSPSSKALNASLSTLCC